MGRRRTSKFARTRGAIGVSIVALAVLALGPASAFASTVSKSGTTLTYTAGNNETNQTIVSLVGANYKFSDTGATVAVGAGCTLADTHTANCASAGITGITINSGNLNDLAWETAAVPTTIFGGDGNDTMIGGNASDVLIGCLGNDTYNGGGGADTMADGAFCTGGGTDTVDYSSRTQSVFVTLDGNANDGEFGEGDNVGADIENITGGSGDDDLTGSSAPNTILGNAGDDGIDGGPGNDLLSGGNDDDLITGGAGADIIQTGSGDNDVEAADGEVDQITCGTGFDTGTADPTDHFNPSCDALDTSGSSGDDFGGDDFGDDSGDNGDFTDELPAGPCDLVHIAHHPVDLQDRSVTIKLRQPRKAHRPCRGTLKLQGVPSARAGKSPDIRWGSASFSVKAGKGKAVQVHISPKGRHVIAHSHHVAVQATVDPKGGGDAGPSSVIVLQSS
jgi:Ca2+-binding RTX toxin-like protein